jgi:hypothetical protein
LQRLDFAVALNVAILGTVTVGWLLAVVLTVPESRIAALAAGSPIVGITFPTLVMNIFSPRQWAEIVASWGIWITVYVVIAALLASMTLLTFDRCIGRVSDVRRPRSTSFEADPVSK